MTPSELAAMPEGTLLYEAEDAATIRVYSLVAAVPGCPGWFIVQKTRHQALMPVVWAVDWDKYRTYGETPEEARLLLLQLLTRDAGRLRTELGLPVRNQTIESCQENVPS